MKFLTWNIACLPKIINLLRNPHQVIHEIIDKLLSENPDIICLQELFDHKVKNIIEDYLTNNNYEIFSSNINYCCLPKNGLLIASKTPIKYRNVLNYKDREGLEWFINKGVLTIGIQHPSGKEILIHNTHMQSDTDFWYTSSSKKCRRKQNIQLQDYLNNFNSSVQFLIGDLNDEYDFISQFAFFKEYNVNNDELITFPKNNKQLDYIICNSDYEIKYKTINTSKNNLSDHNILIAEVEI